MRKEKQRLTLKGYYDSLGEMITPKTDFIEKVARRCGVTATTVRNWVHTDVRPSNEQFVAILSEETGIPAEELWEN